MLIKLPSKPSERVKLSSKLLLICLIALHPVLKSEDLKLHVPSPDWRSQVIYFLMVDRFEDGDRANNDQGIGVYRPKDNDFFNGGDLKGVTKRLDYIQNLGATAVWTTPVVANQWYSSISDSAGYHGYWARDFTKVDEHFGTLKDYQELSDQLHRRGMYLIQDIVVNHTANYFGYDGDYEPQNTDKNFVLYEKPGTFQSAPEQQPFHQIDRTNPEHVEADIYHWTPGIRDYSDPEQILDYQLSRLADLNTENPLVQKVFKKTYSDWITSVGIDAFRIDTVRYAEQDFFHRFMHDGDGIHAKAKETGREHFLAFGEVWETAPAYDDSAEQGLNRYINDGKRPILNSVIGFPLSKAINGVFAEGRPTAELGFRLQAHMKHYPDPYVIPNFIDNHDTARFLAGSSVEDLQLALITLMTIPGIPVIYQGTEQGMTITRQAMFKEGFAAEEDAFNEQSDLYLFIQSLIKLRTSDILFTHYPLRVISSTERGRGILAYERARTSEEKRVVIMNTAEHSILVDELPLSEQDIAVETLVAHGIEPVDRQSSGKLTLKMLPKSALVMSIKTSSQAAPDDIAERLTLEVHPVKEIHNKDFTLIGQGKPADTLYLVENHNLDTALPIKLSASGSFEHKVRVSDLGTYKKQYQLFRVEDQAVSQPLELTIAVDTPTRSQLLSDPPYDDIGLTGRYEKPRQKHAGGQMDILSVKAESAGDVLRLSVQFREMTDVWAPVNGFDNVALTLFMSWSDEEGSQELPDLNANFPKGLKWQLGHRVFGWGNNTFDSQQNTFSTAPEINADINKKLLTLTYRASDFGMSSWPELSIYLTTWDVDGEGEYRPIDLEGGEWRFKAETRNVPRILDEAFIEFVH